MKKLITALVILTYSWSSFTGNNVPYSIRNNSQENVTEVRFQGEATNHIKKIEVSRAINVVVSDAGVSLVSVAGNYSDVQKIKTEIANDTLRIFPDGNIENNNELNIEVALNSSLKEIMVSQAATLEINHTSKSEDDISITASRSSTIRGSISARRNVMITASRSSRIEGIISSCDTCEVALNVSTASKFDGQVTSNSLNISSSDASKVLLTGSSNITSVFCKKASEVNLKKFINTGVMPRVEKDISSKVKFTSSSSDINFIAKY